MNTNPAVSFQPPPGSLAIPPARPAPSPCWCGLARGGPPAGCEFQTDVRETFANIYPQRTDLVATGRVKARAESGQNVAVSLPTVWHENDDLVVSGTVTCRAGYDDPIPGFLDVRVLGPDEELIFQSLVHWTPEEIPTTGTRMPGTMRGGCRASHPPAYRPRPLH